MIAEVKDPRINITDLAIGDPGEKYKLPFDPHQIPVSVWDYGMSKLHTNNRFNSTGYFTRACDLVILGSNEPENFRTRKIKDLFSKNKDIITNRCDLFKQINKGSFLMEASATKIVNPYVARNLNITGEEWDKIAGRIEDSISGVKYTPDPNTVNTYASYMRVLKDAAILKPDILTLAPRFKERVDDIKSVYEYAKGRDQVVFEPEFKAIELHSLEIASALKIIDPSLLDTLDVNSSDWKRWNEGLEKILLSDEGFEDKYLSLAAAMMILQSERVEISEAGVRLIIPSGKKDFSKNSNPPERRKF
jgi:hypothetical protein